MKKYLFLSSLFAATMPLAGCWNFDQLSAGGNPIAISGGPIPSQGPSTAPTEADMPAICIAGTNLYASASVTVDGKSATVLSDQTNPDGTKLCFRLPMNKGKHGTVDIVVKNSTQSSSQTVKGFSYYLGTPKFTTESAAKLELTPEFLVNAQFNLGVTHDLVFAGNNTTDPLKPLQVWTEVDASSRQLYSVSNVRIPMSTKVAAIVAGDLDGTRDTQEIAMVTNTATSTLYALKWNAGDFKNTTAMLSQPLSMSVKQLQTANLDGQGQDELLMGTNTQVTVWGRNTESVDYMQTTLTTAIPSALFLLPGDFDGDGKADLMIGESATKTSFYQGLGTRQFGMAQTAPVLGGFTFDVATPGMVPQLAALEKDKAPYLVASGNGNTGPVLQLWPSATGGMPFGTGTSISLAALPKATVPVDMNLDGKPDLVVFGGANTLLVARDPAQSAVAWSSPVGVAGPVPCNTTQQLVTMLDFNHDSLPDIVVACNDSPNVTVFLNASE